MKVDTPLRCTKGTIPSTAICLLIQNRHDPFLRFDVAVLVLKNEISYGYTIQPIRVAQPTEEIREHNRISLRPSVSGV